MKPAKIFLNLSLFFTLLFSTAFPVSAFNYDYSVNSDAVTVYITDLGVTNKADYIKILIESNSDIINVICESATETNIDGESATLILGDIKSKNISDVIVRFQRVEDVKYELTFLYYYADCIYDTKNISNTVYSTDGAKETSIQTTTTTSEVSTVTESQDTIIIIDPPDNTSASTTASSSRTTTTTKKTTSKTTKKVDPISSTKAKITTTCTKTAVSTLSPEEYERNRIINHMDENEPTNYGIQVDKWKYYFLILALIFLAVIFLIIIIALFLYLKKIMTSDEDDDKTLPSVKHKTSKNIDDMTSEELLDTYINAINYCDDDNTKTFTIPKNSKK